MERKEVFNFSAGPAVLPEPVLKKAADEMLNYNGSGMSVMELSHRSSIFQDIIDKAEQGLRDLMNIPNNYKVLFLQGGASLQFAMVPLNLLTKSRKADYVVTGEWAKKAMQQAKVYGDIKVVASSEDKIFNYIPKLNKNDFTPDADYFHITSNNTIYGTKYTEFPDTGNVPLVADFSSNILSEVIDVTKFGLIYAGAQKNIGPAGVTIVIIREDLIGEPQEKTPIMLRYDTHAKNGSMYNTPPTYGIYIAKLVFEYLKEIGGVPAMQKLNVEKAKIIYDYLDNSKMFCATVNDPNDRSLMNIPFVLRNKNEELEKKFLKEAEAKGLVNLKGHRSVGGFRASIYNAMPIEGCKALVQFCEEFEKKYS